MPRTTAELVEGIVDAGSMVEDFDVTPFINAANALVTQCCSEDDYEESHLALIETWLAAHFYCVFDPRTEQEHAGKVRAWYEGKSGLGLDFTRYGQHAKLLDWEGGLAALDAAMKRGGKIVIRGYWLGTENTVYYPES